jgi:hypothetical protein
VVGDTDVELQLYREKIVAELERRMMVLQDVERRLVSAQFVLNQLGNSTRTVSSSTARRQVENAHRIKLRGAVKALEQEREDAKADLERAEGRLREVDSRLDELSKLQEES